MAFTLKMYFRKQHNWNILRRKTNWFYFEPGFPLEVAKGAADNSGEQIYRRHGAISQ